MRASGEGKQEQEGLDLAAEALAHTAQELDGPYGSHGLLRIVAPAAISEAAELDSTVWQNPDFVPAYSGSDADDVANAVEQLIASVEEGVRRRESEENWADHCSGCNRCADGL